MHSIERLPSERMVLGKNAMAHAIALRETAAVTDAASLTEIEALLRTVIEELRRIGDYMAAQAFR